MTKTISIGIHGGCGTPMRSELPEDAWAEARDHLALSLRTGWAILRRGGSAVDAVEAAVIVMEDSPHFNAGHGAALTEDAHHELDAAIMDGATLAAGAVCAATRIRNPIRGARRVMDNGECVLMAGAGADAFAERSGLPVVDNAYFTTERRVQALASLRARRARGTIGQATESEKHGTVGSVARDAFGSLAAATSTGGYNNKPSGRVGDSPLIGSGTYAENGTCAISCTGMGEMFIRRVAAYDVAARIKFANASLAEATDHLVHAVMPEHEIGAGLVAISGSGEVVAPFNTIGMFRGWITTDRKLVVASHAELHDLGTVD